MKSLTSLLPVFLSLIPVTLQDYHLPDSDEDEETAIQRVMQQVALLATQSPWSASASLLSVVPPVWFSCRASAPGPHERSFLSSSSSRGPVLPGVST